MQNQWMLQDAKNKFSELVNAACQGEPQLVTQRGIPAVVVLSVNVYEQMRIHSKAPIPTFSDFLLSMPTDDGSFEHVSVPLREVDF